MEFIDIIRYQFAFFLYVCNFCNLGEFCIFSLWIFGFLYWFSISLFTIICFEHAEHVLWFEHPEHVRCFERQIVRRNSLRRCAATTANMFWAFNATNVFRVFEPKTMFATPWRGKNT